MLQKLFRSRSRRQRQSSFGVLPPLNQSKIHNHNLSRRSSRLLIIILCILALLGFYTNFNLELSSWFSELNFSGTRRSPPLYPEYRLKELSLPQHNPDLSYPEGRHGKYLWISEHVRASGWGNVLQEHFVNSLLAYKSKRSFVFDNYTWNRDGPIFSDFNGKFIPSRIPMTALISGPLAGGPFEQGDKTPKSVMKEYFDVVCPHPKLLDKHIVRATLPENYSAKTVMDAWLKLLEETPDNCVEIDDKIFDIWIFGSTRVLDILPPLYESPMVRTFRWSPLVLNAVEKNKRLLGRRELPPSMPNNPYPVIPGLLALHIRRGDFESHCRYLAEWKSSWTGFNQILDLVDYFEPPERPPSDEVTQEIYDAYEKSCYPSIEQIVEKVVEIRKTDAGRGLKTVFIMTNGKVPWVKELKQALKKANKWELITSSRDMVLNWEQKYVAQAPDMLIGQRAQVFVGNGFSSLTANIVMLRTAQGLDPESTRMWST